MCYTLIFVLNKKYFLHFLTFLAFISTLPSIQTAKVIVQCVRLENLDFEHAFQPYTYSQRLFLGGGAWDAPCQYVDSDPPDCIGLIMKTTLQNVSGKKDFVSD